MNNYKLLKKHNIKLSIYFSIFILLTLWVIEFIFIGFIFLSNNGKLEKKLEKKYNGVVNIINNIDKYSSISEHKIIQTILEKTLDGVTIFKNKERILGKIQLYNLGNENKILNSKNYKFYQNSYIINNDIYKIIIKNINEYSYYNLFLEYLYFIIFSIPFSIIFFLIGYIFIGKNLKPIEETIESLESFSDNINHEMKTPLTEIISTLSLAKETKNYKESIQDSLNSAKNLNKILDSIQGIINTVNFSHTKEKINIILEINNIIGENKKKLNSKNITIKKDIQNNNFIIKANKKQLIILLGNIINNAIKYSNTNSLIKIKFKNGILQVIDYGIGIEKKNLKNVFKRYFRENYYKKGGNGIGLSLVKKIVDINKWKINIESEKNIKTIVTLNFN